jgi:hypothetical protein
MKRKPDGWNIVLAGFWNRAIFTPEWVDELLFQEKEVETLLSIMPFLPIIYRNAKVAIEVSTPKLVFRPRRLDDECLMLAQGMAYKVLDKLQDTPLLAVGVNFAFVEESPRRELIRLFEFPDNASIGDSGWALEEGKVVRRLREGGTMLNLTMAFDGSTVNVEFNYHTDTTKNDEARKAIRERVLILRDASLQMMKNVYRLEVEKEHG